MPKLSDALIYLMVVFLGLALLCPDLHAAVVSESEPNDSIATAQNIDTYFSLDYSADIGDATTNTSTTIPHVTINGTLSDSDTSDFYVFTLDVPGARAIFDIDYGAEGGFICMGILYYTNGNFAGDDYGGTPVTYGAGGSTATSDPYLNQTYDTVGTYHVQVSNCTTGATPGTYTLQISVEGHPTQFQSISGLTASAPALARNPSSDFVQMLVRASDDTLWASTFDSSGGFNNDWGNIPGLTSSSPALAWNPSANKMQMIVRAADNTLWSSTFDSSGAFNNNWIIVPGLVVDPPALAWNPSANKMQMVVRAADDTLWAATFNSAGTFNNDWVNVPGLTADTPALAWNPSANEMQMVVRAADDTLWAATFNSAGTFNNDWVNVPGLTADTPALAWNEDDNEIQLVVRASDSSIWASTLDSFGTFNDDWSNISGLTASAPGMTYLPSIEYFGIVVRAADNSIWEMIY